MSIKSSIPEVVLFANDDSTTLSVLLRISRFLPSHPPHTGSSGCEGLQFCSATYRLMKIPRKEEEKEETLNEVKYKGRVDKMVA